MTMSYSEAGRLGAEAVRDKIRAAKDARVAVYNQNPVRCAHCERPLLYKQRFGQFCSQSCSASYNNRGVRRHSSKHQLIKCLNCDADILIRTRKKFCCMECRRAYETKQRLEAIVNHKQVYSKWVKKFLIDLRGYKCESCHNSEWLGQKIPLELEHVDGHSDNNDFLNLRLLCPNCHALTPTYKGKNKGNGRAKRRERYHQGKSY